MYTTMKAIVLEAPGTVKMKEIPVPVPGRGEILIRTKAATVCTSDIMDMRQGLFNNAMPIVMGHEGAGVVAAVAGDVKDDIRAGDEVAVHPVMPCHACASCLRGLAHLCDEMEHLCFNRPGVFAEYFTTRPDCVRKKPPGMSFSLASLMEPVCVCLEAVNRAAVKAGDRVLITGDGPFGIMISKLCAIKKPKQIILTGRHDGRLKCAAGPGHFVQTLNEKNTPDTVKAITELTDGEGIDSAVLCVSNPEAVGLCIEVLRSRGILVIFSALKEKTPVDLLRVHMKELTVTGSNNDENYMDEAVRLLNDPGLNLREVITHEIPFDRWEEAFYKVEKEKDTCLKVSLIF